MSARKSTLKEVALSLCPPAGVVALRALFAAIFGHQRWLDPILHFVGGAAAVYCCSRLLQSAFRLQRKSAVPLILVTFFILLWEIGEFVSDRFIGTHVQHGVLDTGSDIVLGLAGAMLYSIAVEGKRKATESLLTSERGA